MFYPSFDFQIFSFQWLAADENLFSYRGAIAFRTYNPSKPAKYGLLIKCLNEVLFPYVYRAEPFLGKPQDTANAEYYVPKTMDITLRLIDKTIEYQDLSGAHLTFDNLYTSVPLLNALLERDIASTGSIIVKQCLNYLYNYGNSGANTCTHSPQPYGQGFFIRSKPNGFSHSNHLDNSGSSVANTCTEPQPFEVVLLLDQNQTIFRVYIFWRNFYFYTWFLGTMRHNRKGIPAELKDVKGREIFSTETYFETKDHYLSLTSYVTKTKSKGAKNVIWASTNKLIMGTEKEGDKHKPAVGKLYDHTKGKQWL